MPLNGEILSRLISSVPKGSYFSLLSINIVSIKNYHPEVGLLAFVTEIHIMSTKYINPPKLFTWVI